jgi:hypothetical protein
MSQGIVTVDAAGLNMSFEGLADPARVWTCFEDFCGALEFLKIDGGSTDTAILGYSGVLCSSDGTAANQVALAAGGEAGGTVVMTPANTTACGITVPTALIDPDNGKRWFIETRLKIATLTASTAVQLSTRSWLGLTLAPPLTATSNTSSPRTALAASTVELAVCTRMLSWLLAPTHELVLKATALTAFVSTSMAIWFVPPALTPTALSTQDQACQTRF